MRAFEIVEKTRYGVGTIYSVYGSDAVLRSYVIDTLKATLSDEEREMGIIYLDSSLEVEDILADANTISMFGGKKIVCVRDYNKTLTDSQKNKMIDYARDPNDQCILILENCGKTFDCIKDYVIKVDCEKAQFEELRDYIQRVCTNHGYQIEPKAIKLIIEFCGNDMGKITNELNKLMLYCQDSKRVCVGDVEEMTPIDMESKVYDLTNALQRGDNAKALAILDNMLKKGEKPLVILSVITSVFRKSFLLANSNADDDTLCKILGFSVKALPVNKSIVNKSKQSMPGYIPYLKRTLDELNLLEYQFKSGIISDSSALMLAITELIGKRR